MVARIKVGRAIARGFYYNEHKVEIGVATCLVAENFPCPIEEMNQFERLNVLQKVASLNPNVKTNSIHISLNFSPGEQLSDDRLREIAAGYMQRIGFGQQPYLVYRHNDAGHPHIHIVSTRIGFDGRAINVHNIGKRLSEPARKEIEKVYGLVKAQDQPRQKYQVPSAYTPKVVYGAAESKRAIQNVLSGVLNTYRYASLPELNAVLRQYNVTADPGGESSRTRLHGGLHYKILDNQGVPVGVPIKASLFSGRPTLKWLQQRFAINEKQKAAYKSRTQNAIDLSLARCRPKSISEFINGLKKQGVHVLLRQNENGLIYGITYIDHRSRCVFNGSELGKNYSAKAVLERCNISFAETRSHRGFIPAPYQSHPDVHFPLKLLNELLQPEYTSNYVPYELSGRKRKKRGKRK